MSSLQAARGVVGSSQRPAPPIRLREAVFGTHFFIHRILTQVVYGPDPPHAGRARVAWLTSRRSRWATAAATCACASRT
eukprot:3784239-Prymnesium_polylepis.1